MGGVMTEDEKAALADLYERAAAHLETHGWHQGGGASLYTGQTCVGVALYRCHRGVSLSDAFTFFCKALELQGDICQAVYHWNDDPDRTMDEVINTLHALANKLR